MSRGTGKGHTEQYIALSYHIKEDILETAFRLGGDIRYIKPVTGEEITEHGCEILADKIAENFGDGYYMDDIEPEITDNHTLEIRMRITADVQVSWSKWTSNDYYEPDEYEEEITEVDDGIYLETKNDFKDYQKNFLKDLNDTFQSLNIPLTAETVSLLDFGDPALDYDVSYDEPEEDYDDFMFDIG